MYRGAYRGAQERAKGKEEWMRVLSDTWFGYTSYYLFKLIYLFFYKYYQI